MHQKGHAGSWMQRTLLFWLVAGAVVGWAEEPRPSPQMENAPRGFLDASWPKKPESRLSSLSGKMKDVAKISPRLYGAGREFPAEILPLDQRQASVGQRPGWDGAEAALSKRRPWPDAKDLSAPKALDGRLQPEGGGEALRRWTWKEVESKASPDWSSRPTRLAQREDGSLKKYEGRLLRVKESVQREAETVRDLGPDRRENFSPEEVDQILSRPAGAVRGAATGQSPAACPLAAADN